MSGFHTDPILYNAAEENLDSAIGDLETVIGCFDDYRCPFTLEEKYQGEYIRIADDVLKTKSSLDGSRETVTSLKGQLALLDASFSLDLSSKKIVSVGQKGNKKVVCYEGYEVYYSIVDGKEVISGVLYPGTNIYVDLSVSTNPQYKRYDPKTGKLKSISIFDDENLLTSQYGASQEDFRNNFEKLITDEYIWNRMQEHYPIESFNTIDDAMDFYERYFNAITSVGCGYAAGVNAIFKQYEGKEKEFEKKFGYPMYTIKNGDIDFNYENCFIDYFQYQTGKRHNPDILKGKIKYQDPHFINLSSKLAELDNFLKDNYEIDCKNTMTNINNYILTPNIEINRFLRRANVKYESVIVGAGEYDLYDMEDNLIYDNGGGHAMMITDFTEDGYPIVSSWGKKYKLDVRGNPMGWATISKVNFD